MFQRIEIIGNVGFAPELHYTKNEQPVTNFTVATNRRWQKDGEIKEEVCWFRISAWGRLAESCVENLNKGDMVFCEGRLICDEYGNPRKHRKENGEMVVRFEIKATDVKFLRFVK